MNGKLKDYIYRPEYECLSRSEMENLQSERLKKTVKYVYENCKPYRAKMDEFKIKPSDIKSVSDLCKLPFTVKHDLRAAYPFGFYSAPSSEIVEVHASSGTTGKLTVVGYTQNDIDVWAEVAARSLAMAGVTKDSLVHVAYGYGLFTGGLGAHYGAQKIGASTVPASAGNTIRQLTLLRDFGATHLCCTPSYAIFLGTEIQKAGMDIKDFNLMGGAFGAEPWTYQMREELERLLNIDALDIYGLSETMGPGVAIECKEEKHGLHIWEDQFLVEILDPETCEPVPDGEVGELVITTINKEGMPTLRYRTHDLTSIIPEPCSCGRTHRKIARLKGRTDDMLIVRGVNVFPSQVETVLTKVKGVMPHYLIVVDRVHNSDTMEVQVELHPDAVSDTVKNIEGIRATLSKELQSYLGISAKVRLLPPKELERSEGKAKRVIDKRKFDN